MHKGKNTNGYMLHEYNIKIRYAIKLVLIENRQNYDIK